MKNSYSVNVGNIGTVFDGSNQRKAIRAFREYVNQSKAGYGRASGENVTLFCNGEPLREFFHPYQEMRSELESGECAVISSNGFHETVTFCGKTLGEIGEGKEFPEMRDALRAIRNAMESAQFWPNIYRVNDRGNVDLLSSRGKVLASWV